MNLLIVTQKMDQNDSVLGFFHRWVIEFAAHAERVIVICLEEGAHDLPDNVRVFSLGKETRRSRMQYLTRFYRLIWRERKCYDAVFVHMNPIYIVLGGLLWRALGKRIGLWYNHTEGGVATKIAATCSHAIFFTSPFAYIHSHAKAVQMPAGIDVDLFSYSTSANPHEIWLLARLDPAKNVGVFVRALRMLFRKGDAPCAHIYGNATEGNEEYAATVRRDAAGVACIHDAVKHKDVPAIAHRHGIFVNLTARGSFDKTVLEMMAAGNIVVSSNPSFREVIPADLMCKEGDASDLLRALRVACGLSDGERSDITKRQAAYVRDCHALALLPPVVYKRLSV